MTSTPNSLPFTACATLLLATACSQSGNGGATDAAGTSALRLYVNASATPGGEGRSWSDAIDNLTLALDLAYANEQIWVAAGTYRPAAPNGDRAASFAMKNGVALYGGFAGTETTLAQRDPAAHPTILSGDLNGDDGPDFTNTSENSYH